MKYICRTTRIHSTVVCLSSESCAEVGYLSGTHVYHSCRDSITKRTTRRFCQSTCTYQMNIVVFVLGWLSTRDGSVMCPTGSCIAAFLDVHECVCVSDSLRHFPILTYLKLLYLQVNNKKSHRRYSTVMQLMKILRYQRTSRRSTLKMRWASRTADAMHPCRQRTEWLCAVRTVAVEGVNRRF